jgi:hypothetical protein
LGGRSAGKRQISVFGQEMTKVCYRWTDLAKLLA